MPDWLLQAALTVLCTGLVTWGVIRTELKYLRRDIDQAHNRLDQHQHELHERRKCAFRGPSVGAVVSGECK